MKKRSKRRKPIWTDEMRAAARARAMCHKPWEKSTGPTSAAGKARSALNGNKVRMNRLVLAEYMAALRYHKLFMEQIRLANTMGMERQWQLDCLAKAQKAAERNEDRADSLLKIAPDAVRQLTGQGRIIKRWGKLSKDGKFSW